MNALQPWNIVFMVGTVVFFSTRRVFIYRTKKEKKVVSRFDALERVLLAAMFLPTLLLPILYLFTSLLDFAEYQVPITLGSFGAVTMAVSLWLFWRSHVDLGQNWSTSLELRDGHQLVTDGVYRAVRHPMYTSLWLWGIAQGTLLGNWFASWSFVAAFAALYFLRVGREEQLMCERFQDEYREYMRRTRRLLPRLRARSST